MYIKEKLKVKQKMKNNDRINLYVAEDLIDSSTVVTDQIIEDDLDYDHIVGRHLITEKEENYFSIFDEKNNEKYINYLEDILTKFSELFFYSDISNNCLYFECLINSKKDYNKKYLKRVILAKIKNDKCPSCSRKLTLKPFGNIPVKVDGVTQRCERYLVYCPNCKGKFGVIGFKFLYIFKDLYFGSRSFFKKIKKVEISKTSAGIELETNFDSMYRCGH
jgi:hypothetical protein